MASPALKPPEFDAFDPSITPAFCSLSELVSAFDQSPAFNRRPDGPHLSSAKGTQAVKAAIVAIGLEAAVAALIFGIWLLWHTLR